MPRGQGHRSRAENAPPIPAAWRRRLSASGAGRDGRWRRWSRWSGGCAWGGVEERAEGGHARDAVGDGVVYAGEQADLPLREPGEEPHLPQRPGPVLAVAAQLLGDAQQRFSAVSRSMDGASRFPSIGAGPARLSGAKVPSTQAR